LGAVSQFIIPIDKRAYSWTEKKCAQLWAEILRTGASEEIGVHFIGTVVHIDEGLGKLAVQPPQAGDRWPAAAHQQHPTPETYNQSVFSPQRHLAHKTFGQVSWNMATDRAE